MDGTQGIVEVPRSDYPLALTFPRFQPARILDGLQDNNDPAENVEWWTWWENVSLAKFSERYAVRKFHGEVSPDKFARLIAKIAHATAVWKLGIDGFRPLASEFILRGTGGMNYLVGCWQRNDEAEENVEHLLWVNGPYRRLHTPLIIYQVRLFGSLGAPTYHVVVGTEVT